MSWKMKSQNMELMFFYLFWCVRAWIHSLQQWFKHCLRRRRYSCPVCMQKCSTKNVSRLYFQSVEDSNNSVLAKNEKDPQDLRCQIQRLEDKVDGLSSLFKFQGKDLKTGVNSIAFCHFFLLITFVDFVAWIIAKKVVPLFDSDISIWQYVSLLVLRWVLCQMYYGSAYIIHDISEYEHFKWWCLMVGLQVKEMFRSVHLYSVNQNGILHSNFAS